MTTLIKYEAARAALAEARNVDDVKEIHDKAEAMRLYGRIAEDAQLEADAADIRERAERQLGLLLLEAKAAGQISRGQPKKNSAAAEEYPRVRLEDAGISHKLSARAQKKAGIAERAYEAMLARMREQIISGKRIADVLKVDAGPINGARSVMGSRQEPDDSLDYFPTPPWATRALIERVFPQLNMRHACRRWSAWEPACGEGHIAEVLTEYFGDVLASDIHDYGYYPEKYEQADFFSYQGEHLVADWIITNPPFGEKAEQFVLKAIQEARVGVAMFLRLQWLETIGRYEEIFAPYPPAIIAQFAERVPLHKGRWEPDGTTATAYLWIVWLKSNPVQPTRFFWIPPGCRDALTKADDVERFTAHPVMRRPADSSGRPLAFDPHTGEIPDAIHSGTASRPDDRRDSGSGPGNSADAAAVLGADESSAGSQSESKAAAKDDDLLDIPDFLRRKRKEPESNVVPLPRETPFQ